MTSLNSICIVIEMEGNKINAISMERNTQGTHLLNDDVNPALQTANSNAVEIVYKVNLKLPVQ